VELDSPPIERVIGIDQTRTHMVDVPDVHFGVEPVRVYSRRSCCRSRLGLPLARRKTSA